VHTVCAGACQLGLEERIHALELVHPRSASGWQVVNDEQHVDVRIRPRRVPRDRAEYCQCPKALAINLPTRVRKGVDEAVEGLQVHNRRPG
jgi:hypothetical protein